MPASRSNRRPLLRCLFILITLARLSEEAPLVFDERKTPFTWADCGPSSSPPSPAASPSQSPSSDGTNNNSKFEDNVTGLLKVLPVSASSSGNGFFSSSEGEGSDRAFVRALCRGDALGECETCLKRAAKDIYDRCLKNGSRRGGIWYDRCFLSYADTNTSTADEQQFRQELYNVMDVSNKTAFNNTYDALMKHLTAQVVNGRGTTLAAAPMFATGNDVYDPAAPNKTMYGLLQCMRDRTAAECDKCLQDSVPRLPRCCYGQQGGVVLAYNCYLRVEIYPYYDLALDAPPAPLPLVPSPPGFVSGSRAPPAPLPLVPSTPGIVSESQEKRRTGVFLTVALPTAIVLVIVGILVAVFRYRRKTWQKITLPPDISDNEEDISYTELGQLNLQVLTAATNNFARDNKLGEGGFGEVFKGTLPGGEVIAVKRLSKQSSQGYQELKNELVLVAKLKHRNLVRLMGMCLQEEKLLIYEYMPNKSLDTILFDPEKRKQLDWSKRFMIICGITRGLVYLHEESRLKVIHRDLKPSNVLLDADMNPKISDFGLARVFAGDQSRDVTRRPVGTLGYMSPEYAYFGRVSTKSDMFSFGVIILETVTGRRSNSLSEWPDSTSTPLLSYVWGKWRTGSATDVVDASLGAHGQQYPEREVLGCLEVGLLCVQENPDDRPDASEVVLMLDSLTSTPDEGRRAPSRPAFFFGSDDSAAVGVVDGHAPPLRLSSNTTLIQRPPVSENGVTISELQPR